MKPVYQTIFGHEAGPEAGNCLQAAVASLLELSLEDVPRFVDDPDPRWFTRLETWLHERGRGLAVFGMRNDWWLGEDVEHLIQGKSPRGDWSHIVVGRGGFLTHDPHPDNTGLDAKGQEWRAYLFPELSSAE